MKCRYLFFLLLLAKVSFSFGNNVTNGLDVLALFPRVDVLRSAAVNIAFDHTTFVDGGARVLYRYDNQVGDHILFIP